jgi:ectoine hydroxylase-related dioxygenase (phytanoyl-CoA dioxygenase family)
MLTKDQTAFFHEQGFLHIPQVFTPAEVGALDHDLERLVTDWSSTNQGWTGPWRRLFMDEETDRRSQLTAMHDLHFYSQAWSQAVTHPRLTEALSDLLGPDVELHHSTMHIKPPETGHPFPLHQDWAFYQHRDGRYVDVLVHLDDTCHANGEIRFLAGSHKQGALVHILHTPQGPSAPHLPMHHFRLEDTVAVPARRGDVVCFCIHTIHGSYINTTDRPRRLVRIGYRHPDNAQTGGQSWGRPGLMVRGYRQRRDGQHAFSTAGPAS